MADGGGGAAGFGEDGGAEADELGHGAGGEAGVGVGAAFEVAALAGVPEDEGVGEGGEDVAGGDGAPVGEEADGEEGGEEIDAVDVGAVLGDPGGGDASGGEADDGDALAEGVGVGDGGLGVGDHGAGGEVLLGLRHAVAIAVVGHAGDNDVGSAAVEEVAELAELGGAVAETVEEDVDVFGFAAVVEGDAAGGGVDEGGVFVDGAFGAFHDVGAGLGGGYREGEEGYGES